MNKMLKMIIRRIVQSVLVIFIVTLMVFLLMQLVDGDPIINFLGPNATDEQIAYYTQLFGFDQPVLVQYFKWIGGLFKGQMGRSVTYQMEISQLLPKRLGVTLSIVIPAFIIAVILGVALGIVAAKFRGTFVDNIISVIANIGMSMPMFWFALLLIMVFANNLKLVPTSGYVYLSQNVGKAIKHSILPVSVLAINYLSQFCRQTRSSMLEVMRQDYVVTARAKGISNTKVTFRHQLRNSLIPIVTVMGSSLGAMVGGTVLIENIFVIPGLGSLMLGAIQARDFLVVENGVLVISVCVAICNLVVDILYGIIDPRIRAE